MASSPRLGDGRATGEEPDAVVEHDTAVYVYELPVRIWHWVTALSIFVLLATGLLIAYPLPSSMGEASSRFVMGYVREVHYITGYVITLAFVVRLYWVFAGNRHARQIFWLPFTDGEYWNDVWQEIRWYAFLRKRPAKHIGHNPLARLAMFALFLLPLLLMIVTGMALYAEGQADGHITRILFGWMHASFNGMELRFLHHVGMWLIVVFTLIHLYTSIREEIMGRTSTLSSIVSGKRFSKDDEP
jgi:Ni/Fe-hydrogenase 1 B-type cytochrome subunit